MSKFEIRKAQPKDPEIAEIIRKNEERKRTEYPEYESEDVVELLSKKTVNFFAAYFNSSPAGIGGIQYRPLKSNDNELFGEILSFYVLPEFRGRGCGGRILEVLEADASDTPNVRAIKIMTGIYGTRAHSIYEKFGYGKCSKYSEELLEENVFYFSKTLELKPDVRKENPKEDKFVKLISELEAELAANYPIEECSWDDVNVLSQENVTFLAAYPHEKSSHPIGMGSVKFLEGYAEIKRLYVKKEWRKRGVAERIMEALEEEIRGTGVKVVRAESGIHQKAALELYKEKLGFKVRGAFGDYVAYGTNLFLEKIIE